MPAYWEPVSGRVKFNYVGISVFPLRRRCGAIHSSPSAPPHFDPRTRNAKLVSMSTFPCVLSRARSRISEQDAFVAKTWRSLASLCPNGVDPNPVFAAGSHDPLAPARNRRGKKSRKQNKRLQNDKNWAGKRNTRKYAFDFCRKVASI